MTVQITTNDNKLLVTSPYNPALLDDAKQLGGKWKPEAKAWVYDARDEKRVRELYIEVYGTDGDTPGDLVTLGVELRDGVRLARYGGPLFVASRQLGRAKDRDSGARLADGIVFLTGELTSGGSIKNWSTCTTKGAVFEIRDLPRAAAEKFVSESAYESAYERVEIIENEAPVKINPLEKYTRDELAAELKRRGN